MKKAMLASLCVLLISPSLVLAQRSPTLSSNALGLFWQKFKTAVISNRKATVASLSQFPIELSYGKVPVKSKAELYQRYREVFNEQSDAAKCFAKKQPVIDRQKPKQFSIACPDRGGREVVVYEFELTRTGWKFIRLDNTNE